MSKVFNSTEHVLGFESFVHENQDVKQLACFTGLLMAIADAGVSYAFAVTRKKVAVLCDNDSILRKRKRDMLIIRGVLKSGLGGRRDINASPF